MQRDSVAGVVLRVGGMTPFVDDGDFRLFVGDALTVLRGLPDESVHCCVTSPPYWGLRDYGTGSWTGGDDECNHKSGRDRPAASTLTGGTSTIMESEGVFRDVCGKCGATRTDRQLGLEATPDEYVAAIVQVFREVRRVLRSDGTLWLNLGDSYNNRAKTRETSHQPALNDFEDDVWADRAARGGVRMSIENGDMKEKDMCGIPWMVAFALRADGWYLRSDIIWAKPNPMPESVTDRPTKAHEYVFLLTKGPRYYFDSEAVREEYAPKTLTHRGGGKAAGKVGQQDATGKVASGNFGDWDKARTAYPPPRPQDETLDGSEGEAPRGPDGRRATKVEGRDGSLQHRDGERWPNGGRNVRTVWEIATQPYPEAHFATFPEALPDRCIRAGTSERGCCPVCGAAWVRVVETTYEKGGAGGPQGPVGDARRNPSTRTDLPTERLTRIDRTLGWRPSCGHDREPVPATVLDCFAGSGTTALVARKLGRRSIGIELSAEYAELCARRLQQQSLFAGEVA